MAKPRTEGEVAEQAHARVIEAAQELDRVSLSILGEIRRTPRITVLQLAERVGVHRTTIIDRMKEPAFKRAQAEMMLSTTEVLDRYGPEAARVLGRQLNVRDEKIKQGAAGTILRHVIGDRLRIEAHAEVRLPEDMSPTDAIELARLALEESKKRERAGRT